MDGVVRITSCLRAVVNHQLSSGALECGTPGLGRKPGEHAARMIDDRPLDHRRMLQHEGYGFGRIEIGFLRVSKLTESGAFSIDHDLPAQRLAPRGQALGVGAGFFVVVKVVSDLARIEPRPRLSHRVAVRDAVEGGGHGRVVQ